jgi:hypothetical protein
MNSMVIDSVRGVNRIEAFVDSQRTAGLHEANPAELQAVEGGIFLADDILIIGGLVVATWALRAVIGTPVY